MPVTVDGGFPVSAEVNGSASDITWPTFTTPGTNRMVIGMLLLNGVTPNAVSSFTSPNLTWTLGIAGVGNTNWRVEIWWAWAASVVTTEQINTTYSGTPLYGSQSAIVWSLNGSESSGIGNTGSRTSTTDPTVDITSSAAGSLMLMGLPYRSGGGDIAVLSGTTSQYDAGDGGGFGFNERAASKPTTDTSSYNIGYTNTEILTMGFVAGIEIKAAAAAAVYPRPGSIIRQAVNRASVR